MQKAFPPPNPHLSKTLNVGAFLFYTPDDGSFHCRHCRPTTLFIHKFNLHLERKYILSQKMFTKDVYRDIITLPNKFHKQIIGIFFSFFKREDYTFFRRTKINCMNLRKCRFHRVDMYGEISVYLLEICLATIGVCNFRCADFGWRTFYFLFKHFKGAFKWKKKF